MPEYKANKITILYEAVRVSFEQQDLSDNWAPNISVCILYSGKYWRELNLAVEPQITIAKVLADLNLAMW